MDKAKKYCEKHLTAELAIVSQEPRLSAHEELSLYDKAIIYKYSEDGYESLNESLRGSKGKRKGEYCELLEQALNKLPNYQGLVYRGAKLTKKEIKVYQDGLTNGNAITEHAFISTSRSQLIAGAWIKNCLFTIYSKSGKQIENIAYFGIDSAQNEKEILFRPNTEFKVLEVTKLDIFTLITMEEL